MVRTRAALLFTLIGIFFTVLGFGQISQGGKPIAVNSLKSSRTSAIEMPVAEINQLLRAFPMADTAGTLQLKPLRFAHPFVVELSPHNSGQWFETESTVQCWQLTIRSRGAKSINLIFNDFHLPQGARLFVYNEDAMLGAYTPLNNKQGGKFAISPLAGDELTIQYEVPATLRNVRPFVLTRVNHDYVGILKNSRRPLGKIAGDCNIDVNCAAGQDWGEVKNSVCRLIVDGTEICSGVLINNAEENGKPYILSAAHCYDRPEYAATTIYTFNYESPFCAPLDGDPSHSVSGAVMKAQFDSLDFALTEMSLVPPPAFRAYYAGWDLSDELPDSTVTIHHPQGDIKKIAFDNDPPEISNFNSDYVKNGFLKIGRWDGGVTEMGSSGGPLFSRRKQIVGILTGGVATCRDPVKDYFNRFNMAWNYKADSSQQLAYWLDPRMTGSQQLNGRNLYDGEDLCASFTNLSDNDTYSLVSILTNGVFQGYWGGSNSAGITAIMERFAVAGKEQLAGISLGVGKIDLSGSQSKSEIRVQVYNGNGEPEELLHEQRVRIKNLKADAMNYISFDQPVEPADTFFVGFDLSFVEPADTFVVYQSLRKSYEPNSFYLKQNQLWTSFNDANPSGKSMVNIFELVACNITNIVVDTPLVKHPMEMVLFPNPATSTFRVETGQDISENSIAVYNLLGQAVRAKVTQIEQRRAVIDLSGNVPGVYVVRFAYNNGKISRKISYIPH